jgi:hypothetical protein
MSSLENKLGQHYLQEIKLPIVWTNKSKNNITITCIEVWELLLHQLLDEIDLRPNEEIDSTISILFSIDFKNLIEGG